MGEEVPAARIAIVDDVPLFRIGLRATLDRDPRFTVVADTGSAREAIEAARAGRVDAATVNVVIEEMAAALLVSALRAVQPNIKVLVVAILDEAMLVAQVLRSGALAYVDKRSRPEAICAALARVLVAERHVPGEHEGIERLLAGHEPWPLERLTCREREVFALMVEGCSNDDIATRLFIARRTVEAHRHHVMHKLSARSLVDLVRIALRSGIPVR